MSEGDNGGEPLTDILDRLEARFSWDDDVRVVCHLLRVMMTESEEAFRLARMRVLKKQAGVVDE